MSNLNPRLGWENMEEVADRPMVSWMGDRPFQKVWHGERRAQILVLLL